MVQQVDREITDVCIAGKLNKEAHTAVVFIHGVGGNPITTWTGGSDEKDAFWPSWIDSVPETQVWTANYPAQLSNWFGPDLPLRSNSLALLDRIMQKVEQQQILLVCHSLGGLLAKQMLYDSASIQADAKYKEFATRLKGIVFLGTPHQGSSLPIIAERLAHALGLVGALARLSRSNNELRSDNLALEHLGDWFRTYAADNHLDCLVYSETRPYNGKIIVDPHSSNPGLIRVQSIPLVLNHAQLAGPRKKGDQISEGVLNFIKHVIAKHSTGRQQNHEHSDFVMSVSLLQQDALSWLRGDDKVVFHTLKAGATAIQIGFGLEYLEGFRTGGPIFPMSYMTPTRSPFLWEYPQLDFKFLNNTSKTAFLNEIIFNVEKSEPVEEALFVIRMDNLQSNAGVLTLMNEGWIDIENITLSFNVKPGKPDVFIEEKAPYSHQVHVGQLHDRLDIDVMEVFEKEGVNLQELIRFMNGEWRENRMYVLPAIDTYEEEVICEQDYDKRLTKAKGIFHEWVATFNGEILYQTKMRSTTAVKFETFVYLANENRRGLPRPSTFQYEINLESTGVSYLRSTSISHEIKAGETDRFSVKVGVPTSSKHILTATVKDLSGNEMHSVPIVLECFVPRSSNTTLKPKT